MNLEEAIKHYENLPVRKTILLAEWLKELKHYRVKNKKYHDLD